MNFIRNPRWHDCDPKASIRTHFCSEKFTRLYGHPITCFPTADLFKQLRILKLATLEVVENRSEATVYRIRQTGVVYLCRVGEDQAMVFTSHKDYLQSPDNSGMLHNFFCKPMAYIIERRGYQTYIHRLKYPRFSGIVDATPVSFVDLDHSDHRYLYDIEDITWHDHPPATEAENRSLSKKTTLFLRSNYLPVAQAVQANQ
jgi:hypothetical protein